MKAFIVDDSAIVRERLENMISEIPGIEFIGDSGYELDAIERIRRLHPDVVILDIRMPEGNGMNVLKDIKSRMPSTKVIMLTNYPYRQYRKKCMEMGADYFYDKSKEFEEVMEVLEKLAQDHRAGEGLEKD